MNSERGRPWVRATIMLLALGLSATALTANAQSWPQRTVKWIVPLGPGSGADVTARLLAEPLGKRWGQPIVIENKPGADGVLGLTAFLSSPDDHTLLFTPTGTFTTHPLLHEKLSYDPHQLIPIARVSNTVISVAVPGSASMNSLADAVASIRAAPGKLHWASVTGSTDIVFAGFLKRSGLDMVRVPYRDPVQAVNDLSEGRIDVFLSALVTVRAQAQAGRVKLLALTNQERTQLLPDVPTAAQAGFPALTLDGLAGLFGTVSLPVPVRERIAAEVRDIIANSDIAKRIADTGQIVSPGSPAEFTASIEEQSKTFAAIAELLGLKIAQQ